MGWELGFARAVGAISFSIIIGLLMALIFRKEEKIKEEDESMFAGEEGKPVIQLLTFFGVIVVILLFGTANIPLWSKIAILITMLNSMALVLASGTPKTRSLTG